MYHSHLGVGNTQVGTQESATKWPVGQVVKTAASHAANRSSILLRVTIDSSHNSIVGVDYGEGPPVPISNTVVKLTCADNTWLATAWEDK